ncbi:MAG TPA: molybdenum cofactor guanylyltransferase MobA, partial [Delftia acidovorans]|nr:molybdenum cofactor guanylyltransferase MobA [Delftia acidovorans]
MPPSSHPAPLHASLPLNDITGCVLAGGRGMRMGGIDKGLQPFLGQPLAAHALDR